MVVATKLDRLARSTHQLISLGKELEALGVDLVITEQALDTTTPTGRLLFHVLAALAEFERELIRDRVVAGIRRARAQGRPRKVELDPEEVTSLRAQGATLGALPRRFGCHVTQVRRALTKPGADALRNPA